MHRVQGYLQRHQLQGLQAQGTVQEELQEIIIKFPSRTLLIFKTEHGKVIVRVTALAVTFY